MNAELDASTRIRILRKRLSALNQNTDMDIEIRLKEIRRAEQALHLATRDLERENRHLDKVSRAVKPITSPQQLWDRGMEREGVRRKT